MIRYPEHRSSTMPVVIRFGRLGDMVLQTPLLHLLHMRYGQPCRLVTSGYWTSELLRHCEDVDGIWQLRHRHRPFLLSPERWRLVHALRRCTGPIYVSEDATRQLPKIRRLLGFAQIPSERCLFLADELSPPTHWVDRLLHFGSKTPAAYKSELYPVPQTKCRSAPKLFLSAGDRADRDAWLHHNGISHDQIVLLQPGNKRAMKWGRARASDSKAWPERCWVELARAMRAKLPHACLILCGSADEEPMLMKIKAAAGVTGLNVVTRELPLRRLMAVMEIAHSLVSIDTGPSHIAGALGCPQVVLYGSESRAVWGRRGSSGQPIIEMGGPPECHVASDISSDRVIAAWCNLATQLAATSARVPAI